MGSNKDSARRHSQASHLPLHAGRRPCDVWDSAGVSLSPCTGHRNASCQDAQPTGENLSASLECWLAKDFFAGQIRFFAGIPKQVFQEKLAQHSGKISARQRFGRCRTGSPVAPIWYAVCRDFSKNILYSPLQLILMAYCRPCFPFPVVQGKVSLLLDMKFSRFRKGQKKPLHLLMQKHDGFDRMFLKTFSKNFQISFLSIFFSLRNRLFFLICTEFCDIPSSSAISLSVKPSATMWQIWY